MLLNVNETASKIEQLTGHTFKDKLLAAEAVQMAAPQVAIQYGTFRSLPNNKRLSVLGNALLAKILCDRWFKARDSRSEPLPYASAPVTRLLTSRTTENELSLTDWSTLRNDVLGIENLAAHARRRGVDACVYCNEGTVVSTKMAASALEAIVGAAFQDGGDEAVLSVFEHLGLGAHGLLTVRLPTSLLSA